MQQVSGGALQLQSKEDIQWLANTLAASGFFEDAKNAHQACVKLMIGMELGMSPMESVNSIYFVKGKPGIWARDIAAKLERHPHYGYSIVEHTEDHCTVQILWDGKPKLNHLGQPVAPVTFHRDQAAKLGLLNKQTWLGDMMQQMFYKALTRAQVLHASDLYGLPIRSREDLEDGDYIDVIPGSQADQQKQAMLAEPGTQAIARAAGRSGRVRANVSTEKEPSTQTSTPAQSDTAVAEDTQIVDVVATSATPATASEGSAEASQPEARPSSAAPSGNPLDQLFADFCQPGTGWTKNKIVSRIAKLTNKTQLSLSQISPENVQTFREWARTHDPEGAELPPAGN